MRVPWTTRRSILKETLKEIQSILEEISPEYSSEGLMLKLKLKYFGHLMQRANSLENRQGEKEAAEDETVGYHQ